MTISGTAPPGFNATEVDVHSNTAGVSVAPPSRSFPPGPFTGTWILTGVTPGQLGRSAGQRRRFRRGHERRRQMLHLGHYGRGAQPASAADRSRHPEDECPAKRWRLCLRLYLYARRRHQCRRASQRPECHHGHRHRAGRLEVHERRRHRLDLHRAVPHRGRRHIDLHLYRHGNAGDRAGPLRPSP